jgi:hypothetical protein
MIIRKVLTAAGVTVVVVLAAVLASPATRTSASNVLDMRGTWHWVSYVDAAQYPQTLTITNEDLNTGAFSGSDSGGGTTYSAQGGVSGNVASVTLAGHGYTARSAGTVSSSGGGLTWSGTFTDSQGAKGARFSASMTGGGGAAGSQSNTASARPATPTAATTPSGRAVVTSSPLALVAPTTAGSNNGGGGFPVLPVAAVAAAVAAAAALGWAVMARTASADAWLPWVNRGTGPLLKPGGGAPEAGPNYGGPGAPYTPDRPLDLKLPEAGPNYGGVDATYTSARPHNVKPTATTLDGPPPAGYDLKPTDPSATPPGYDSSPSIPPQTPTEEP